MPTRLPHVLALAAFAAFTPTPAYAYHGPPPEVSYAKPTSCGTYRFVVFGRNGGPLDEALRAAYPATGLYRVGAPAVPLWVVGWYEYESCVEVARDGVHLVRIKHRVFSLDEPVLEFFASGFLLRAYSIRELVDDWTTVPVILGGRHLRYRPATALHEGSLRYQLTDEDGSHLVFDITTGQIVSEVRPLRRAKGVASLLLLALNLAIATWILLRPLRARPPLLPPEQAP